VLKRIIGRRRPHLANRVEIDPGARYADRSQSLGRGLRSGRLTHTDGAVENSAEDGSNGVIINS
jgi:hypothetical protein